MAHRIQTLSAVLLSAAGTLFAASALALLPAAPAQAWWTCPSGKDFQTRSSNAEHVRCVEPPQLKAHDECPNATAMGQTIGTAIRRDFQGILDKCVGVINGVNAVIIDPTCAGAGSGYLLERRPQPNADRCVKPGGASAPTHNVN